jgi:hypothetical protein
MNYICYLVASEVTGRLLETFWFGDGAVLAYFKVLSRHSFKATEEKLEKCQSHENSCLCQHLDLHTGSVAWPFHFFNRPTLLKGEWALKGCGWQRGLRHPESDNGERWFQSHLSSCAFYHGTDLVMGYYTILGILLRS